MEKIDNLETLFIKEINGYRVIEKLLAKNLYSIYLVEKENKKYILRLYNSDYEINEEFVETKKALSNKFPNQIVKIYEIQKFSTLNCWYEISEFLEYGSLEKILSSSLSTNKIKIIIKEIFYIIYILHQQKITNLNLTIENILINSIKPFSLVIFYIEEPKEALNDEEEKRDYLNFGFLLLKLLFSKESEIKDIDLNKNLDESIKNLIKGLITKDSQKRWGYRQVVDWFNNKEVKLEFKLDDFMVNKKVINDKSLYSYIKRYKEEAIDYSEKEIVEFLFLGKLEELYKEHLKNPYKANPLKSNFKKIKNHYDAFDNKTDVRMIDNISLYLKIINNQELYILPKDFEKDSFSLFQVDYIITKKRYDSIEKNSKIKTLMVNKLLNCDTLEYINIVKFLDSIDDLDLYYVPFDFYNKLNKNFSDTIVYSKLFVKKEEIDSLSEKYFFPENIYKQTVNLLTLNSVNSYQKSLDYIESMKANVLIDDFEFIEKLRKSKDVLKNIKIDFTQNVTIEDLQKIKNIKESNIDLSLINKISRLKKSRNKSVNVYIECLKSFKLKWQYIDQEIVSYFDRTRQRNDNNQDIIIFGSFITLLLYIVSLKFALISGTLFIVLFLINNFISFTPAMPENLMYQNRILEIYKRWKK